MQVLALPFVALFIFGVAVQVLTYRKEKAVKPRRIVISQTAALLSMMFFSIVTFRPPGPIWWLVLLSFGFGCGIAYGSFVKVRAGERGVTMSYTLPWLIVWGALMTLTQLTSIVFSMVPALIYGLAILNLGINIGMNARILIDYRTVAGSLAALLVLMIVASLALAPVTAEEAFAQSGVPDVFQSLLPAGREVSGESAWLGTDYLGRDSVQVEYEFGSASEDVYMKGSVEVAIYADEDAAASTFAEAVSSAQSEGGWSDYSSGGVQAIRKPVLSNGRPVQDEIIGMSGTATIHVWVWSNTFEESEVADASAIFDPIASAVAGIDLDEAFRAAGADGVPGGDTSGGDDGTAPPVTGGDTGGDTSGGDTTDGGYTGDGYTATGSDTGQEPLNPVQTSIAIAISSILLAGGSLVQLSDRFDPADIFAALKHIFGVKDAERMMAGFPTTPPAPPVPPAGDPLAGLPRSADGRVCLDGAWMSAAEAEQTLRMRAQGMKWDGRWGWVTDEQRAGYEAVNAAGRAYNLQQDPELARITRQIQLARARDAANVEFWKQVQFDAQREYVLKNEVRSNQATSDALAWDVSAAEWAYRGVAGVGLLADMGISWVATLATFTPAGPAAHALRAGYNMAKGIASSAGEVAVGIPEVDPDSVEIDPETGKVIEENLRYKTRRSFNSDDLWRGVSYGVENNVWDFGMDAAARRLLGEPQLWNALKRPPAPPASLLVPKAATQQLLKGVEETAAKEGVEAAAAKIGADKINRLMNEVGRKNLGQLEAYGQISKNEAAVINHVIDQQVEKASRAGVSEAARTWDPRTTGARLERIILGDSGSSTGRQLGKVRSVLGDHDKTVGGIFNARDVAKLAKQAGKSQAEMYAELNKKLTEHVSEKIAGNLPKNLSTEAADLKLYSGMGETAGQADDYARGFTRLRSDVQGVGTSTDAAGVTHNISGRQVVDEIDLMGHRVGSRAPLGEAAFPVSEFPQVATRQIQSLSKEAVDPRTAAKAFDRLATMAERGSMAKAGVSVDPHLTEIAREILRAPQAEAGNIAKSTMALLQRNGFSSQEQFAQALLGEGQRVATDIHRVAPTLVK